MSRYPTKRKRLTLAEQDALAVRAKAGDLAARNALIEAVIPAVASQVVKISKYGEDREDYVQEAAIKLLESVRRYEPTRGHFISFALPWAAGGRHVWKHKQGWLRAYDGFAFVPMEKRINSDAGKPFTVADTIAGDEDTTVEQESTRRAIRAQIDKANLNRQEQCVLELALRFNLEEGFQTKCAELMDLSRERVGQIWTGRGGNGSIGVIEKLRTALAPFVEAA